MEFSLGAVKLPFLNRGFFTPSLGLMPGGLGIAVVPARRGHPVLQALSLQVLREGEATPDAKWVTLFRGDAPLASEAVAYYLLAAGMAVQQFSTELLRGQFLVQVTDNGSPRLGLLRWPVLDASTSVLSYNLTEGHGGGGVVTRPASVQAAARVDGEFEVREVVVVERQADGQWRIAGAGFTDDEEQQFIALEVTDSGVCYALGMDDSGELFEPGKAVGVGSRVRPTVFSGVLYQVTEAGELPADEPEWWPITSEGSRELGTARAEAVRYYRPLAHGPVTAELS